MMRKDISPVDCCQPSEGEKNKKRDKAKNGKTKIGKKKEKLEGNICDQDHFILTVWNLIF